MWHKERGRKGILLHVCVSVKVHLFGYDKTREKCILKTYGKIYGDIRKNTGFYEHFSFAREEKWKAETEYSVTQG